MNSKAADTIYPKDSFNKWEEQTNVVTHNDLIDAYLRGKEAATSEQQRINQSLFETNLQKAQEISENIFRELNDAGLTIKAIHIKADAITNFNALFITTKEDYLKDEFRNAFILTRKEKEKNESSTFNISFLFTPGSETLDEDCIAIDGFFIKYHGTTQD